MITILIADDHEIVRAGLKFFIDSLVPHPVIDEASDGNSAFKKVTENQYELIIMDINMPGTNSFKLVESIISIRPGSKILIFSINPEDVHARRYLQLGAKGYISKNASVMELANAITAILENKQYINPLLSQAFTENKSVKKSNNPFETLSSREFQIVQYIMKGETISDICNVLNLKASTVSTYKTRIFEKLKCKNIIQLCELVKIYNIAPLV
jgi:DNA-binding NarL/FixJ family response regulator